MSWLSRIIRRRTADADLDDEIRFHLAEETRLRVDRGESPERAAAGTQRDFGNVLLVKETTRQMWGWTILDAVVRDLRYSLRLLERSPAFTAIAILSLGLGIGANTAIFSLADAVIFRRLPVHQPEGLMQVRGVHARGIRLVYSYPLYRDIRDRNQVFASTAAAMAAAIPEPVALEGAGVARRDMHARVTVVTGNYFATLGIGAALGRALTPDDDRTPAAHPAALISHRFWKRALDGAPEALQMRLVHNGVSYAIVGVAPAGFTGISSNDDPDVWLPMRMAEAALLRPGFFEARGSSSLYVFGRLKTGVSDRAASADLARVFEDVQRTHSEHDRPRGEVLSMARGVQTLRERFEKPLFVLLGVVGLLLLIACANLGALLLARAAERRGEIAVRLSLGASRRQLARQFLIESLVLAALGAGVGLAIAAWTASTLIDLVTTSRKLPITFTLDQRILLFTGVVSMIAVCACGVFPSLQASRIPLASLGRGAQRSQSRLAGGRVLITSQMALSLFLLIAAGLFVRSLGNLRQLDTGFRRENVLVLNIDPRAAYGQNPDSYLDFYRELPARLERLPGVRSASLGDASFFGWATSRGNVAYEGYAQEVPQTDYPHKLRITPRFTETFGLSLIAGRTFSAADNRQAGRVALVSESLARRYYGTPHAVGRRLCFSDRFARKCAIEIVGVVRDVRYDSLRESSPFTVYIPILQEPRIRVDLQVRTLGDPGLMAAQVQDEVRRLNPQLRVVYVTTLERLVDDSIVQDRLLATLSTWFAVAALALAVIGLYGITSYAVQSQTKEIGVRMALGASGARVQWMVVREVLLLVTAGAAVGIPVAFAASGLVRSLLFDLTPTDPMTVAGATVTLILTAALAGYIPARRATRIDPIAALRVD